jgi:hypothetical protein
MKAVAYHSIARSAMHQRHLAKLYPNQFLAMMSLGTIFETSQGITKTPHSSASAVSP